MMHTGCFAILGRYVDTGANLGKQEVGDEIFVSRHRFARLGVLFGLLRCALFLTFLGSG